VVVIALVVGSYGATYGWARLTHRLVFNGHDVTGPNASRRPAGVTTFELVFFPLSLVESTTRRTLGWNGGGP
jgi:hypothetical protein